MGICGVHLGVSWSPDKTYLDGWVESGWDTAGMLNGTLLIIPHAVAGAQSSAFSMGQDSKEGPTPHDYNSDLPVHPLSNESQPILKGVTQIRATSDP